MLKCPRCKTEFKEYTITKPKKTDKFICQNCKVVSTPTSESHKKFSVLSLLTFAIMTCILAITTKIPIFKKEFILLGVLLCPFVYIHILGKIFVKYVKLEEYKKN